MNENLIQRRYLVLLVLGLVISSNLKKVDFAFAQVAKTDDYLLMITSDACPWCEAFEEEVGVGYPLTAEGRMFPLHRLDYFQTMPDELKSIEPAIFTPTFIVIKKGREAGRVVGYPGEELFWWRISEFIKLDSE